jgi:uncharacterized protein (TIGR02284 family)
VNTEKSLEILNQLIEINNDRLEGYKTAGEETVEADVQLLVAECIATSQKCREELAKELRMLGGTPIEGTTTAGKIFRVWMDVKAGITLTDRRSILNSCQYGDEMTIQSYEEVLAKHLEDLTISQQNMVRAQCVLIKADRDGVKNLRDMSPK